MELLSTLTIYKLLVRSDLGYRDIIYYQLKIIMDYQKKFSLFNTTQQSL